jgi:ATP-dependent DNA helicase DinG
MDVESQVDERPPVSLEQCFPFGGSIRSAQEKALDAIQRARETHKRFVLLELPTGTGKSAVGFAAATWAANWGSGGYILSTQKALTAQYMRDFEGLGLVELRGRSSYHCSDFQTNCDLGPRLRGNRADACVNCPYKTAKERFVSQKVGVTNFDYFLAETLYSGQLPRRSILVVDEAHGLEQKLLDFTDFEIAPFSLQKYSVAIPTIEEGDITGATEWLRDQMIPAIDSFINTIPEDDLDQCEDRNEAENLLRRIRRFVRSNQQEWVFWADGKRLVFRPLGAAAYAREYLFSRADMVVIMSATILDFNEFRSTLGIPQEDSICVAVSSEFPVENRRIFYRPLGSMNFQNKSSTLPRIADALDRLLRARPGVKGLIHTNSYEMNRLLTQALIIAGHQSRIVTHGPGGAEAAIERHVASGAPTVLCSPAMTEGLDLRDDLSRFQVIVKVPYLPFKDPYVMARRRVDKAWYAWQTAMRLIQATGRSVRSENDFAETYIVDSSFADFRRLNQRLLPSWWRAAIVDVSERKPPSSTKPGQSARDQRLF